MKKFTKKLKGKKVLSFVLAAIMLATTFNMALPMLKLDVSAASTIDGVTQERVVGTDGSYAATYENYAANYLNGASKPTNIVIPGLHKDQDYVIQGMTYYPKRDWMLVTAYHNVADGETTQSSKVFALDAATGEFVAMFSFLNPDGSVNTDHGGGIAVSEHNLYYSCGDKDRKIAYAPLSALDNAPTGQHTKIQLVDTCEFVEIGSISYDSKTAYSAYVCYDEGVLWMGNFYDKGATVVIVDVAADYNAPSNDTYNSMVFGYKLSGNDSATEWANLIGATGSDCKGNPSYAIGLNNNIKDVQYATVDNGKLYLSRSYGSGAGNSVTFGFGESSYLTVADIDLSVPGTEPVTISTTGTGSLDKTVMAYDISNYKDYAMMPMSEGLCVIEDEIFVTFEGASNKYLNESSGLTAIGNCEKPVDVIWQLDPYKLMEVEIPEPEKSIYYEKVNSFNDIKSGEEYLIVHESAEESPVTQKPYLYALDAFGNFKEYKLPKSSVESVSGYDGALSHPIEYYSFVEEDGKTRLYLDNPETDDVENVRWTLTHIKDKSENKKVYRITNTSSYFANCNNFYVDESKITMAPSNANFLDNMELQYSNNGEGGFWLSNSDQFFIWCNEGTSDKYNTKINDYYHANSGKYPIFEGVSEQPGTFHCDALNFSGSNILDNPIDTGADSYYREGLLNIYRRVVDDVASTYESRVYTNLDAELQADGTYTVMFDTYAISPNHYKYVGERPTDYIFVADTTASMGEGGSSGIKPFTTDLKLNSLCTTDNVKLDNGVGVSGYGFSRPEEEIYFLHSDGKYYRLYVAINLVEYKNYVVYKECRQRYWVYYIADDGLYYVLQTSRCCGGTDGGVYAGITPTEFRYRVDNSSTLGDSSYYTNYSTDTDKDNRINDTVVFSNGTHYRFDNINSTYADEHTRVDTMVETAVNLMSKVAADNADNRLALVQFGGTNGYWNTSKTLSTSGANAFWTADQLEGLFGCYNGTVATNFTDNSGAEMVCVNNIIANSDADYTANGDRNLAIVYISDGVPGQDGSTTSTKTSATTAANNILSEAFKAKNSGAFIYSVIIGNNAVDGFDKKTFMDAVSSKYPAATKMDNLGGQSVDGVNYALNLADCSINAYVNFGDTATKEIYANTEVGLDNLDANSYLRGVLGDAFKFPENGDYSIETNFVPGEYDEIGRFSFGNPTPASGITTDVNTNTKTITVTGYDYSKFYISKGNTEGKALRIEITGLLANELDNYNNIPISIDGKTGIYKTQAKMNSDDEFKGLPIEYNSIPEYTYVLDYGLDLLDTDVNGTLKSVSADLSAQRDDSGKLAYKAETQNGLVKIQDGAQNLIYHTTPTNTTDSGYVLIQRDDGTYDWFEIEIVPASNVYFEETEFAKTAGTGTVAWETTTDGTSAPYRDLPGENDPVGYDAAYDNTNTYSNGTVLSATVDSTNKRSKTATVSFKGNGIDIISACGPTTGMQIINIKNAQGKSVAASIVDTYYKDDTFTQVPVFSWRGNADPDEVYTVETTAVYLSTAGALNTTSKTKGIKNNLIDTGLEMNTSTSFDENVLQAMLDAAGVEDINAENLELVWFDDNSVLNGGTGVAPTKKGARAGETTSVTLNNYIDGFRIYNPLGSNYSTDFEASEQGSMYYNVIDNLADGTFTPEGSLNGEVAFVTGSLANGETLSFANYESIGPKNELYLKGNAQTAVAFKTPFVDGVKVMVSLRAVDGPTTVKINEKEFTVKSATEMYYDITDLLVAEDGKATVSITNSGSGILAVNNIKLTNTVSGAGLMELNESDIETVRYYATMEPVQATVENGVVTPVVEEEVPEDNTNTDTETEGFSIFSFVEMLIAFIEKILYSAFGAGSMA